jgi:hypothetical protein
MIPSFEVIVLRETFSDPINIPLANGGFRSVEVFFSLYDFNGNYLGVINNDVYFYEIIEIEEV